MSTANKLSYLNDTKSLLRTSLNKFGSSILSTDTFRSYDTKLNDIYDKLPKITQSGAGFTLSDVQNGLVDDFKMNGVDLVQNTTTGKNLLNNQMTSQTLSGVEFTVNADKSITMSGTASERVEPILWERFATDTLILKAGETYYNFSGTRFIIFANGNYYVIENNNSLTPSTDINVYHLYFRVDTNETVDTTIYPMLTKINDNTYEQYTFGASPNPDYPQDIKVVEGRQVITDKGKNLFDKDNAQILNGYIKDDNGIDSQQENWSYLQSYVPVLPNTTYTISGKLVQSSNNIRTYYYDNSKNWISKSAGAGAGINIFTFTTPNNCYYIQFQMNTDYYDINSIQIEEDSTATDYEPYYNPVGYNIDLTNDLLKYNKCDFTPTTTSWYFLNGSGSAYGSNIGTKTDIKFPVEINKKYTLRYNISIAPNTFQLCYENENVVATLGKSIGNNSFTFTSDRNGYVIPRVQVNASSQVKITDISVVEGEEDYYDYKLAKIPNTTYKNKIYKNNGNWYFEENVEKIILDGSEEWDSASSITNTSRFYTSSNALNSGDADDNNVYIMSDNFKAISWKNIYSGDTTTKNAISNYNNPSYNSRRIVIRIDNNYASTINEFKTWLSTHNVIVYYVLATPTTTQITNTTLINQLEAISVHTGTNIITISNDNNIIPEIEITRLKELEKLA